MMVAIGPAGNSADEESPFLTICKYLGSGLVTGGMLAACFIVFFYYNFGFLFRAKDETSEPPGNMDYIMTDVTIVQEVTQQNN